MKRSWKHTRIWKRLASGLLTAAMLVTMLPTTAFAALWENGRIHNQEILTALENLCGSKDEAQHYYALLDEYGLLDEDGGLFSNWSGVITIQEKSRPLTIGEARTMTEGDVTVNGSACVLSELKAMLDRMEQLGLLVDNVPAADWQLQVDGQTVPPIALSAALDNWTAPDEAPKEDPEQSGSILASFGRSFGIGAPAQSPAAPVVTVLGKKADSAAVLEVVGFLAQYGLLTETGAAPDWNLALSGGGREIAADELLALVKDGALADDTVVNVDGTPVTVADLKVMLEIEEYIAYLRETYFDGHQWSQEQLDSLDSLMEQINSEGIDVLAPEGERSDPVPFGGGSHCCRQYGGRVVYRCCTCNRNPEPFGSPRGFGYSAHIGGHRADRLLHLCEHNPGLCA